MDLLLIRDRQLVSVVVDGMIVKKTQDLDSAYAWIDENYGFLGVIPN